MVSKARDDLPEPDKPLNTTSWSRGISRSTFLRLCSRAPRIEITRLSRRGRLLSNNSFIVLLMRGGATPVGSRDFSERRKNDRLLPPRSEGKMSGLWIEVR